LGGKVGESVYHFVIEWNAISALVTHNEFKAMPEVPVNVFWLGPTALESVQNIKRRRLRLYRRLEENVLAGRLVKMPPPTNSSIGTHKVNPNILTDSAMAIAMLAAPAGFHE